MNFGKAISMIWFNITSWIEDHPTLVEAVLTVAAIGIAWRLLTETQRQVDEAQKQVLVSKEQLDLARESSHKELKAYVNISRMPTDSDLAKNPLEATFYVKNFGQTPAYDVGMGARFLIADSNDVPNPATVNIENEYRISLAPTAEIECYAGTIYPTRRPKDPRRWIIGRIRYIDVFHDTTYVTFRYLYVAGHDKFFAYTKDNYEITKVETQ